MPDSKKKSFRQFVKDNNVTEGEPGYNLVRAYHSYFGGTDGESEAENTTSADAGAAGAGGAGDAAGGGASAATGRRAGGRKTSRR